MDQAWGSHWPETGSLRYLTVAEVCERSRLSRATVYRAMDAGHLDYVQHPRRGRRVEEGALADWMGRGFPTA
jgi:excisionase family DNA binding protein